MSSDTFTTRNRWIAGLVILAILVILALYAGITTLLRRLNQPEVDQRSPIDGLSYCGANLDALCIVAFSQEVDGGMQVNFETPNAFYPEFILKIIHDQFESTYACERVEATSTGVVCTGDPQVPGEVLQFQVISKHWGTIFAEGKFAIIGIALYTPEVELTGTGTGESITPQTPIATGTATATITPRLGTPTASPTLTTTTPGTPSTPSPTLFPTSYPNPYP